MHRRFLLIALCCGLIVTTSACGNYTIDDAQTPVSSEAAADPFDEMDAAFQSMGGALSHGEADPNRAGDGSVLPFDYEGGEFTLDYTFRSEGNLGEVGFFLFLDGVPQTYKVDSADGEAEYCHTFAADGETQQDFSILFTPSFGASGETHTLTVVSITNPNFKPDMDESSSYGWYHQILPRQLELDFNADAPDSPASPGAEGPVSFASLSEEKVTASFLETELAENGWGDVTLDTLDDNVYYTISYDGKMLYDNLDISGKDTVKVRFTLCGTAGKTYGVSLFADHQPVPCSGAISYPVTLTKGTVAVIEATIDASRLSDFTTFYMMAVPYGESSDTFTYKTSSILLYKEG